MKVHITALSFTAVFGIALALAYNCVGGDCAVVSTTPCNGFVCPNNTERCLPDSWVCDGDNDCGDYSDEAGCPCDGFACPSGKCLPSYWTCDGADDCGDWSDESEDSCPCRNDQFRCEKLPGSEKPGACIPIEWVCDEEGIWDCPGGADEANCTKPIDIHDFTVDLHQPETVKSPKANNIHRIIKAAYQRQQEQRRMLKQN